MESNSHSGGQAKMDQSGPANPNWKGGRVIDPRGYILIRVGKDHPMSDVRGYAYEHRLKTNAQAGEQVHHINENPSDNKSSNLKRVKSFAEHRFLHRKKDSKLQLPGEPNPLVYCECGCSKQFQKFDSVGRPRQFVSGHNMSLKGR